MQHFYFLPLKSFQIFKVWWKSLDHTCQSLVSLAPHYNQENVKMRNLPCCCLWYWDCRSFSRGKELHCFAAEECSMVKNLCSNYCNIYEKWKCSNCFVSDASGAAKFATNKVTTVMVSSCPLCLWQYLFYLLFISSLPIHEREDGLVRRAILVRQHRVLMWKR